MPLQNKLQVALAVKALGDASFERIAASLNMALELFALGQEFRQPAQGISIHPQHQREAPRQGMARNHQAMRKQQKKDNKAKKRARLAAMQAEREPRKEPKEA